MAEQKSPPHPSAHVMWQRMVFDVRAHPYVQRLHHIHQLGNLSLVLQLADVLHWRRHSQYDRWTHSFGVSVLAALVARKMDLEPRAASVLQLAAMLHDVGHGPFSHELDRVLPAGYPHHEVRSVRLSAVILSDCWQRSGAWRRLLPDGTTDLAHDVGALILGRDCARVPVVVGHALNARNVFAMDLDRMDYLVRDARALLGPAAARSAARCVSRLLSAPHPCARMANRDCPDTRELLRLRTHLHRTRYRYTRGTRALVVGALHAALARSGASAQRLQLLTLEDARWFCEDLTLVNPRARPRSYRLAAEL